MRNRTWRRLMTGSLSLLLAVTQLTGCAGSTVTTEADVKIEDMEPEESYAVSPDVLGGKDVMPLAGYYGPYVLTDVEDGQVIPEYNTDEVWSAIAECGINFVIYSPLDYVSRKDQVMRSLDFGEKYNLGVAVTDWEIVSTGTSGTATKESIAERMSAYMNHPAFAGVYLVDEPSTDYFHAGGRDLNSYKEIANILNNELGIFAYQQAFPSTGGENEHDRYEQYIKDYCDTLNPPYLLYDRYPFDATNKGKIADHFFDLAIIRKTAKDNNIPFWAYIGAGSQWNEGSQSGKLTVTEYYPDEGQFDWHVNTCLAFGMQGMVFFPLIQPYHFANLGDNTFDFAINGVLSAMGSKNRWWYYIQDITKHITAIDEVLMNAVNKGVIVSGEQVKKDTALAKDYDAIIDGTSWRELKDVSGDAIVGCFNYQGKTALYVVNYSTEYAQHIDLTFQKDCKVTVVQNAETKKMQGTGMTLDMLAGEGALLIFE